MSAHPDNRQVVRRIKLPSGKTIEVFYPGGVPVERAASRPPQQRPAESGARDLAICPDCTSDLVYPVDWEAREHSWELTLRCPNCEWMTDGSFAEPLVEALDEALERGSRQLVHDLRELTHANMAEEIERFVAALVADHVQPDDF